MKVKHILEGSAEPSTPELKWKCRIDHVGDLVLLCNDTVVLWVNTNGELCLSCAANDCRGLTTTGSGYIETREC